MPPYAFRRVHLYSAASLRADPATPGSHQLLLVASVIEVQRSAKCCVHEGCSFGMISAESRSITSRPENQRAVRCDRAVDRERDLRNRSAYDPRNDAWDGTGHHPRSRGCRIFAKGSSFHRLSVAVPAPIAAPDIIRNATSQTLTARIRSRPVRERQPREAAG